MSNPSAEIESSIRQKLRLCSLAAKGVWYMMREQIEQNSGRDGHLLLGSSPLSLAQFAHSCGCVSQEVCDRFGELVDAGLIAREMSGGAYYSPMLVSIAIERKRTTARVREWRAKNIGVTNANKKASVTNAVGNANVTPKSARASPLASSLPLEPPLNSTPPFSNPPDSSAGEKSGSGAAEDGPAAAIREAASADGTAPTASKRRRRKERVLSDEQQRIRVEFSDWWMSAAWPRHHGGLTYGFEPVDGAAVLRLLRHPQVKWDLEKARKVAEFYLTLPELYGLQGHPLLMLAQRVNYFFGKMAQYEQRGSGHVIGLKPAAAPAAPARDFSNVPSKRSIPSGAGPAGVPGGDAKSDRGRAVG